MDKTNTDAKGNNLAEHRSDDVSHNSIQAGAAPPVTDEIKRATIIRMEELWRELAAVWPAVRMNPEVANKMERLWSYLKGVESEYLVLPDEIEELVNNALSDAPSASGADTDTQTEAGSSGGYVSALNTDSASGTAEIDDLLAEILGESYRLGEKNEPGEFSNKNSTTRTDTKYITGSKELDEMVASILGEGWEKDDTTEATEYFASAIIGDDAVDESQGSPVEQKIDATSDDFDLDALVDEILAESEAASGNDDEVIESVLQHDELSGDEYTNTELLHGQDLIDAEEQKIDATSDDFDLDALVDEILAESETASGSDDEVIGSVLEPDDLSGDEYTNTELLYSPDIVDPDEKTQFSPFESDISDEDFARIISEAESAVEFDQKEQTLDELVKYSPHLKSDDSNQTGPEKIAADHVSAEQDQDILRKEPFGIEEERVSDSGKKDTAKAYADGGLSSERVGEIPPASLNDRKPDGDLALQTLNQKADKRNVIQKKGDNRLALALMLVLLVLIVSVGSWQYLISSNEVRVAEPGTDKDPAGMLAKPEPAENELASISSLHSRDIAEPDSRDSAKKEQPVSLSGVKDTSEEQRSEIQYDNNEYRARIEKSENEITIVINEPLEEESVVFNNDKEDGNVAVMGEATTGDEKTAITSAVNEKKQRASRSKSRRKVIVHTVVKGDTLWGIAKRYVNNPYEYSELARLSKIKNPDRIYPGNKVRIIKYSR